MVNRLIEFSIKNPMLVILGALLMAAAGLWAVTQLPIDAVPDVTNVQVQVLTKAPALGPEEIEQFITFPIEAAMSGVPRVEEIRSLSQFGLSAITIVFEEGTDIFWARQQVGERLVVARDTIPAGVGVPELGPLTTGLGEIYQFEVRALPGYDYSLMKLREILDWQVAYQLRSVPGVIEVNTFGGELKTYEVQLDPDKIINFNISIDRVLQALRDNNLNQGGGYIVHDAEQRIVRGEGLIKSLGDVEQIVVDARQGTPIYIRDIGTVRYGPLLRQGAVTRDGRGEVVTGIAMLLIGENARTVVDRVKAKVEQIQKTLPQGVVIDTFYDRTDLVRKTIATVVKNLTEGGVLVIVVLVALLGTFRAGLIVALAVPLSMLGSIIGMLWSGLSGNLMSLGAIDFGLIVDGSVVMIENVIRRVGMSKPERGNQVSVDVIRDACLQVARPVVFGVTTIILVYLPILSLRGIEGKMFRPMAYTVVFALVTSLVLALTLMPALAALFLRKHVEEEETAIVRGAHRTYEPVLRSEMKSPGIVAIVSLILFLGSIGMALRLGAVFVPKLDEDSIAIQSIRLPSVSLESSVKTTTEIEKLLREFQPVSTVVSKTGRPEIANDPMTANMTDILVMLKPHDEWQGFHSDEALVDAMKEKLTSAIPGNSFSFTQPIELRVQELVAGVKSDVGISLYGDDLATLKSKADEIARVIETVRGAADVQTEQVAGLPFLRVKIKRDQISRLGISATQVLDAVSVIGGRVVGQVYEGQRRFPLQVRLAPYWRQEVDRLRRLTVADAQGRLIPLDQLAELVEVDGPAQISREAIRRRIIVQCNVRGRDLASFVAEAQRTVDAKVPLPPGYMVTWGGQFKNLQEASARLAIAVPVALLLIFLLLHTTFGSASLAVLIFLNVPMAATGGIVALWLRGLPFSISAGVGFIALFGVAVLNGVVLVTYIVELRRTGQSATEAASHGALSRMRPVLMTALVAILGFVPMAISTGSGAEVQRPLATVVIGGLVTSTLLTLIVLPTIYHWFEPKSLVPNEVASQ
ncbi:CusA/CzcA family heavy metal efflux RND transporter [bacterium]|nr:CusA/CzcA family heavy metal efflux RND transporter [bacterium]